MAVSFDLFGTLVAAERPASPARAVARELAERGGSVPDDWPAAYAEPHVDAPEGAEIALPEHVRAALASRGVDATEDVVVREAVVAAFDRPVRTRSGAVAAVDAAAERGPVGVLSNCSVPGLVERALDRSALDPAVFDAVVASVDCGWRKPDRRAFAAIADELDVGVEALVHVGDDSRTDGGIERLGGTAIPLDDVPLSAVPERLDAEAGRRDAETERSDPEEGSPCR
ncbi:HAD family hydrolase [Natronoarchaeum rubrum]|uniref:HAD family hydrolase n=1 Tax=Natronoarchaeum rubrum TaxID=755311 RepID=UPI002112C258|nr:HAD family hydrolase [Natronoarchaeum rubrum]